MNKKKIFILNGNPDNESFSTALVKSYAEAAQTAGHEVRTTHIYDMKFDPILHKGYKRDSQDERLHRKISDE